MTKNNYNIEHIIDALYNKGWTNFLTRKELMFVKGKLDKKQYKIYELYEDSSKIILYKKNIPSIKLFKIVSNSCLRHQDIMGTIFSLGIKEDTFGDIVKYNGEFYIFVLPQLADYFKFNLNSIRRNAIELEEVNIEQAMEFKQEYIEKQYVVSSLRIDNVISTIINCSRSDVIDKFRNKEVVLNYDDEVKPTRTLRENDFFSVRRYGKFKYKENLKETKKGGFIILVLCYV